jgi:hypothetical protein
VLFVRCNCEQDTASGTVSQPACPEDARWNADRQTVEFGVEIGECRTLVGPAARLPRLLPERATPEGFVGAATFLRSRFENIVERNLHRRQLTEDGGS